MFARPTATKVLPRRIPRAERASLIWLPMAPKSCAPLIDTGPEASSLDFNRLLSSGIENACSSTTLSRRTSATANRASASSHSIASKCGMLFLHSNCGRSDFSLTGTGCSRMLRQAKARATCVEAASSLLTRTGS